MDHALRNKLIEVQGWPLVLFLCFSCLLGGVNPQELPKEEMDALQALKTAWNTSTPDFDTSLKNWNNSRPCGDLNGTVRANGWNGVTCDFNNTWPTGVTVTELDLIEKGIVGILPSDVSKLRNLRSINLWNNKIYGPIPKELLQLQNLLYLDLGNNKFSGELPFTTITNGSNLRSLDLSNNQLNGTIGKDDFRNLGQLEILVLRNNRIYGPIPKELLLLQNLLHLDLGNNTFSGELPFTTITNGSNLRYLDLANNQLNGTIGKDDIRNLGQLEILVLRNNRIYGPIPKELLLLQNLLHLDLGNNTFSGELPFTTITNGSNLRSLDLSNNQLNGTIGKDDFRNLGQLEILSLWNNSDLHGPIPKGLVQLQNLTSLYLTDNMFSGEFPFSSIINGSNLRILYISRNQFIGTIGEDAFRNRGRLDTLILSSNKFTGQAPHVSNLTILSHLDLSKNQFIGQAPDVSRMSLLQFLDLSQNGFIGKTPDVSNLSSLQSLNLSQNGFIGESPDVSKLSSLQWLDLSQNGFTNWTPNFYNGKWLDLSHNNFTGHLPSFEYAQHALVHLNLSSSHSINLSKDLLPFLNKLPQNLELLDLSSIHVGGGFAPDFSNLSLPASLSALYLHKDNFIGTLNITAFLESNVSKSLKILSLEDNMITDVISPNTSIFTIAIRLTKIFLQGNPYCKKTWTTEKETRTCSFYCANTCDYIQPKKDRRILIMATSISSAIVVLIIFLVIVGFGFVLRRKEKHIQDLQKKIKEADVNTKRFDYNELRVATKNFAPEMKLGEGGYGTVYKGVLASNVVVAVKQLLLNTYASREEFVNEVLLISNLQHQNLVALKGYCLNDRQTLLVYEYVDNCDLDKLLLGRQATTESTSQGLQLWKTRLKICQGVAQGLHYLHTFSQSRIIHRDIKASNILVNENFEAKIADFGLARLIAGSVIETSRCAGTFGYLAPEYVSEGQLSEKADVYSFGVLLLEIVSGMRNRDQRMPEGEMHLASWASNLHKTKRLLDMKDPTLIVSEDEAEEVQRVLETAVLCLQNNPKKRPAMMLVAVMLAGKANGDELPPVDEELDSLPWEESDCDLNPLFSSSASAPVSLASSSSCNPQIELSSSKSGRLWRTGGV